MKIKKIRLTNSTFKLIKLKLIKSRVYKHKEVDILVENIEIRLKKVLHLIHEYHKNKKKILFLGVPSSLSKKIQLLFNKTRHILLPDSIWINGVMTNQYSCFQYLLSNQKTLSKKVTNLLFKLRNKSDLVVVLNAPTAVPQIFESYKTKVPIIALNSSLDILNSKITYKVPGNFHFYKKQSNDNFFYSILGSIFQKANLNKNSLLNFQNKSKKKPSTARLRNFKSRFKKQ